MSGIANWQAQIRIDIEDLKKRIKVAEGEINNFTNEDRKVKLDIDTKTLESAIQKLDKMLGSLGKGTGDFKQFENLSKELSSIVSEVQSLSKAFGKVDDSGAKTLLSSIQNIDKSLSELSQNILNVNKNMSNMGGNTSGAVKQVENISNAYQDAAKEAEKLADAQSKIGQKTNISLGNKIDEAVTSAKDLDKTLNQVNIPTDSFDKVLEKLDRTKSELIDIVKITKKSVSDAEGKFHDSYTLKDSRGSTEIYGVNSKTDKGQILRQNIVDYDAKKDAIDNSKELLALEKELQKETEASNNANRKKFQDFQKEQANYEESINKVNSAIQKTDKILDTLPLHDKLDSQFLDMIDSVDNLNSKLKSGQLTLSEYKNEVKSLTSEYSKMIDIQQKRDVEEYNAAANTRKTKTNQFKKIDDKFNKYSKQYTSLENSPAGYDHNDKYKAELEAYDNQLKAIKTKIQAIKDQNIDVVDQKDLSELDKMYTKLDKINDSLSHIPATQKGSTKESRQKVFNMINELKQFTGMARESKLELEAMEQRFKNLGTNLNVSEAISEVKAFKSQLVATNQTTKNLLDTVKDKAWYGWAAQLAGMFSFYDVINGFRQVTSTVIDLNTQITELAKVSEQSSKQIYADFDSYADIAKEVRGTISDTIAATSDWSKNGYSIPDSKQLAEVSQLYKNVGDGINIDEANESLISTLQGFKLEADQAEHIVDVFNEVDLLASYYSNVIALCIHMHIDSNYIG